MKRTALILMMALAGPAWLAAQTPVDERRPAAASGVVSRESAIRSGRFTQFPPSYRARHLAPFPTPGATSPRSPRSSSDNLKSQTKMRRALVPEHLLGYSRWFYRT